MKTSLVALVAAAVIGLIAGLSVTAAEFWNVRNQFVSAASASGPLVDKSLLAGGVGKVVVVNGNEHDFGVIERNVKGKHTFIVRNEGTAPLSLELGHTTCKCTLAELKDKQLEPGAETQITLEWEAMGYVEDFRQSAEIRTSDPQAPVVRLSIHGRVLQSVRPVPEEVRLSSLSANEDGRAVIKIYGFTPEPLAITSHSLSNPDHASHFDVAIAPLAQDDIDAMPDAKSGQMVTLTIKSGLPIGPLNQTIRLATNVAATPSIDIPVHLTVTSDISLILARGASDFAPDKNLLRLGKLTTEDSADVRLYMLVRGPHSKTTQIEIESVEPSEALQVTLGDGQPLGDGKVMRYPVDIKIPRGTRPIIRQGGTQGDLGKIKFKTTHPIAKEVRLFVQFSVSE